MGFYLVLIMGAFNNMENKLEDIFKPYTEIVTQQRLAEDACINLETSALLAKNSVPFSHRKIALDYLILKRIIQFQIVQPAITVVEKRLLSKYGFTTLENSTVSRINSEISKLKEWALSTDDILRFEAIEVLKIRVKELKHILSNNYTLVSNEIYNGYKAIDTYLSNITNC